MADISSFSWATVDFGTDNDASDDFLAYLRPVELDINHAASEFGFPGVDGIHRQYHGKRGKLIECALVVMFKTSQDRIDYEDAIEATRDRTYELTLRDRTYDQASIVAFGEMDRAAGAVGWIAMHTYRIVWMVHTP
jgi:hypothetical protein